MTVKELIRLQSRVERAKFPPGKENKKARWIEEIKKAIADVCWRDTERFILSGTCPWPLKFTCPNCGAQYETDCSLYRKRVQCAECSFKFEVTRDNFTGGRPPEPAGMPSLPIAEKMGPLMPPPEPGKPKPQITPTPKKKGFWGTMAECGAFVILAVAHIAKFAFVCLAWILVLGVCLCTGRRR